ncbi:hypothetical protein [Wolbachia endosymbiont of Ctenocephalides felis wCfeJ]|uniref:hypothetical protein n=1 Tax=Wolbachia endosymbiont of Ctenocephalides felis wCfeJ TaxID=2732594 RepID=UPI001FE46B6D|nr:hypothetical protein [Wolbachia endosymbiont of Ctenocephalides felis wCfeJ]WCR57558.1 MAG: hypothetical protein PG980_000030 [Wolbachia endosymbiont of Ctenocephalides felis wCfeJ]
MGIIGNFLTRHTKNNNTKGVKLALSLNKVTNNFKKLFSLPFGNTESFNTNNNQVLTRALEYAVDNLDHDTVKLLINAGANVNTIDTSDIVYKYKRALAHEKEDISVQARKFLKDHREKCCLVLGELVIHGAMPKNGKEKKDILRIFKEVEGFNEFKEVAELKLNANSISNLLKKPPITFQYQLNLLSKEPIYTEVYDSKVGNSLKDLDTSEEPIYAEPYKESTENLSLEDSGYSSVSEEPIYAKVDLSKKRAERKAKDIKANSETYHHTLGSHSLVKDKISQWQERMKSIEHSELINQQRSSNRKVDTKANLSVKEIKQKYESKHSGYDSSYDAKVKQLRTKPKVPNPKVNSVNVKYVIEKGTCAIK